MAGEAKFWECTIWFDNIIPNWQDRIENLLQIPFAYCIHDKDRNQTVDDEDFHDGGDPRKVHLHLLVAFSNTTTYKNAMNTISVLNQPGKKCFNTVRRVRSVEYFYNYLIHDTADAKKKEKHLYSKEERITGNNFDIGALKQVSIEDKKRMRHELAMLILDNRIKSYHRFYMAVLAMQDSAKEEIAADYSSFFRSLCVGFYNEWKEEVESYKAAKNDISKQIAYDKLQENKDPTEGIKYFDQDNG